MRLKYGCAFWEYNKQNRFFLGPRSLYLYLCVLIIGLLPDFPFAQVTMLLLTQVVYTVYLGLRRPFEDKKWGYLQIGFQISRVLSIAAAFGWNANASKLTADGFSGISLGLQFVVLLILVVLQIKAMFSYVWTYLSDFCEGSCLNWKYKRNLKKRKKNRASFDDGMGGTNTLTSMLELAHCEGKDRAKDKFRLVDDMMKADPDSPHSLQPSSSIVSTSTGISEHPDELRSELPDEPPSTVSGTATPGSGRHGQYRDSDER